MAFDDTDEDDVTGTVTPDAEAVAEGGGDVAHPNLDDAEAVGNAGSPGDPSQGDVQEAMDYRREQHGLGGEAPTDSMSKALGADDLDNMARRPYRNNAAQSLGGKRVPKFDNSTIAQALGTGQDPENRPEDYEHTAFDAAPASDQIEDRRGETTGPGESEMQKLGRFSQKFPKYAEGGEVEESPDDQDTTGSIPPDQEQAAPQQPEKIQGSEAGMARPEGSVFDQLREGINTLPKPIPGTGAQPQPQEDDGQRNVWGMMAGDAAKRFMAYIKGADAAPPATVQALEGQVDPQGMLDEDTRKQKALSEAKRTGGTQASAAVLAHYIQKYDHYRAVAAEALKAGDTARAAKEATAAYSNMLDGNTVQFMPNQDGTVSASIKGPSIGQRIGNAISGKKNPSAFGGNSGTITLTPQQFNEWLTGMSGQYDSVMDNGGASNVLAQLTRIQNAPGQQTAESALTPQEGSPRAETPAPPDAAPAAGPAPGAQQGPAGQAPGGAAALPPPKKQGYLDKPLEERSRMLFPMVSQNHQRLAWMEAQKQQTETNETARIRAGQEWRVEQARVRGASGLAIQESKNTGRNQAVDTKARTELQKTLLQIGQKDRDSRNRTAARLLGEAIKDPFNTGDQLAKKVDQVAKSLNIDVKDLLSLPGVKDNLVHLASDAETPAAAQPAAPQAPKAQRPAPASKMPPNGRDQYYQYQMGPNGKLQAKPLSP